MEAFLLNQPHTVLFLVRVRLRQINSLGQSQFCSSAGSFKAKKVKLENYKLVFRLINGDAIDVLSSVE